MNDLHECLHMCACMYVSAWPFMHMYKHIYIYTQSDHTFFYITCFSQEYDTVEIDEHEAHFEIHG